MATTLVVAPGEVEVNDNELCSFREAILNANDDMQVAADCPAGDGTDVLELAQASAYSIGDYFNTAGGQNGLPPVTSAIVINGNQAVITRDPALTCNLDGSADTGEFRILFLASEASHLTLNNLTLGNGCADGIALAGVGGAIRASGGTLVVNEAIIEESSALSQGGGVYSSGANVNITGSTISHGFSDGGGNIFGESDSIMTIERGLISAGIAGDGGGGGIGNAGELTIINTTISANFANASGPNGGGGISNTGTVTLVHATVARNAAHGGLGGGGIFNSGILTIKNSIVANARLGSDCTSTGTFTAVGDNLDTDGTCAAIDSDFDQVGSEDLALGPLSSNGGPNETHSLLQGSVAVDTVSDCTLIGGKTPVSADQRGIARPQGAACDIGAFERMVSSFQDGFENIVSSSLWANGVTGDGCRAKEMGCL